MSVVSFPGFQEYEQSLLLLEHGRNPFRGDALRLLQSPQLEPGKIAKHDAVGQFAIVYKMRSGGKHWALRCPKAGFPADVRERCSRIAQTRSGSSSSYLLETTFADAGMFAGGQVVPVMLMEWADGENLRDRIENLCTSGDRQGLANLAQRFRELCAAMDRDRFAHGDLSHGNIQVRRDGSIVLVDYDTVYREGDPAGRRALAGTPGYIHPNPSEALMQEGLEMDSLPRMIIQLALDAYSAEPKLFGRYSQETLLLDQDDLEQPLRSARLNEIGQVVPSLRASIDEMIRTLDAWQGKPRPAASWAVHPSRQPAPTPSEPVPVAYRPGEVVQPAVAQSLPKVPYAPGAAVVDDVAIPRPQKPGYKPGETLREI